MHWAGTASDIKKQFLTEGIALTLIGGITGYLLGMIIAYLASMALPFFCSSRFNDRFISHRDFCLYRGCI